MIDRHLEASLRKSRSGSQAALVLGPRQAGKTELVRHVFSDLPYVNLESPLERAEVLTDPHGFLARFPDGAVLDEIQNTPELVSYLQVRIDEDKAMGAWAMTGSQQLSLAGVVNQSLAGRVANFELLPFSYAELADSSRRPTSLLQAILTGGYPPIYDPARKLDPTAWLADYIKTFVNQDIRSILEMRNVRAFDLFLQLCAARTGQEMNKVELAARCSVDSKTIDAWLGALETGFVVRLVRPYHRNFGKRMVKRPRVYFLDTGLACRLLGITTVEQLFQNPLLGALTESWYFTEVAKHLANRARKDAIWSWRTNDGLEVDFVLEVGGKLIPMEAKANSTPASKHAKGITKFRELGGAHSQVEVGEGLIFYGGDEVVERPSATFVPWMGVSAALDRIL